MVKLMLFISTCLLLDCLCHRPVTDPSSQFTALCLYFYFWIIQQKDRIDTNPLYSGTRWCSIYVLLTIFHFMPYCDLFPNLPSLPWAVGSAVWVGKWERPWLPDRSEKEWEVRLKIWAEVPRPVTGHDSLYVSLRTNRICRRRRSVLLIAVRKHFH